VEQIVQNFLSELKSGWPNGAQLARILIRLTAAALLGAVIGFQRERMGKAAGLRTHMLVSAGAALFVVACIESGMSSDGLSRVVQGLATGIGFIGAGAILKLAEQHHIIGLTTAASIWMTAAVGVALGLGRWGLALVSVVLTWGILTVVGRLEFRIKKRREDESGSVVEPKA